ncbi:hypothetical protein Tco_0304532, partial [Tanacetum coccineum]
RVSTYVKKINLDVKHSFKIPSLSDQDAELMRFFEEHIQREIEASRSNEKIGKWLITYGNLSETSSKAALLIETLLHLTCLLPKPSTSQGTHTRGRTPNSLTLEIHYGGWFTPTPSRSYIGGHVSSVNVVDIDGFCLHDLKDMVVKLGYGVEDLMYCHFLIPSLGLDYGLHNLNVDADVLEMAKYVKDYKIILVYVEHGSSNVDTSIFVTPKKGVAIAVDNHLRKAPIEIDSNPDVNKNLTHTCHRI